MQANIPTLPSGGGPPLAGFALIVEVGRLGSLPGPSESDGRKGGGQQILYGCISLCEPHPYHTTWFSGHFPIGLLATWGQDQVILILGARCLLNLCQMCKERDALLK